MSNIKYNTDIIGQRFGKLTVIDIYDEDGIIEYECQCDCGNIVYAKYYNLIKFITTSCGCLTRYLRQLKKIKHGKSDTRLYNIWNGMIQRCYNQKRKSYKSYGERGIAICDEWKNDFLEFEKWAFNNGYKIDEDVTIERINNNGNYEPNNCTWIPKKDQSKNRKSSIPVNGYKCISEYIENTDTDLNANMIRLRLKRGWSLEEAISIKNLNKDKYIIMPDGSTLRTYCLRNNINYKSVLTRIRNGMSLYDAITIPIISRNRKR